VFPLCSFVAKNLHCRCRKNGLNFQISPQPPGNFLVNLLREKGRFSTPSGVLIHGEPTEKCETWHPQNCSTVPIFGQAPIFPQRLAVMFSPANFRTSAFDVSTLLVHRGRAASLRRRRCRLRFCASIAARSGVAEPVRRPAGHKPFRPQRYFTDCPERRFGPLCQPP
jgi:hypothetical protein